MGISTVQIVLLVVFGCIAGMGSVLDSFQTHRPLIACTVVGLILGDVKTGILLGGTLEVRSRYHLLQTDVLQLQES